MKMIVSMQGCYDAIQLIWRCETTQETINERNRQLYRYSVQTLYSLSHLDMDSTLCLYVAILYRGEQSFVNICYCAVFFSVREQFMMNHSVASFVMLISNMVTIVIYL